MAEERKLLDLWIFSNTIWRICISASFGVFSCTASAMSWRERVKYVRVNLWILRLYIDDMTCLASPRLLSWRRAKIPFQMRRQRLEWSLGPDRKRDEHWIRYLHFRIFLHWPEHNSPILWFFHFCRCWPTQYMAAQRRTKMIRNPCLAQYDVKQHVHNSI